MREITILDGFHDFKEEPQQLGLVVKSYGDGGSVQSPGFGKVLFQPHEVVLIDEERAAYFVNIEIERPNQHPEQIAATLPYEEIDRMVRAAHVLIRGGRRGLSRMANFEASVSSSDTKIRMVVFNLSGTGIVASIEISGIALFFRDVTRLSAIADCLVKSKAELDRIKIA